jgi:hypothetical protein
VVRRCHSPSGPCDTSRTPFGKAGAVHAASRNRFGAGATRGALAGCAA